MMGDNMILARRKRRGRGQTPLSPLRYGTCACACFRRGDLILCSLGNRSRPSLGRPIKPALRTFPMGNLCLRLEVPKLLVEAGDPS